MIFTDRQSNTLLAAGIFLGLLLLLIFVAALANSKAGEVAGAFGNIFGGIIGAAGAAVAVYLTLTGQQNEDRERIRQALIREVLDFSIIVMGILRFCESVRAGELRVPKERLSDFMKMPLPIIYPAVADKIGLLRSPQQIVSFYMKIMSVKQLADIMSLSSLVAGDFVDGDDVKILADPLAKACQVAKWIIEDSEGHDWFDGALSEMIVPELDEIIKSTTQNFELRWAAL